MLILVPADDIGDGAEHAGLEADIFVEVQHHGPAVVHQVRQRLEGVAVRLPLRACRGRQLVADPSDFAAVGQQPQQLVRAILIVVAVDDGMVEADRAVVCQPVENVWTLVAGGGQHGREALGR